MYYSEINGIMPYGTVTTQPKGSSSADDPTEGFQKHLNNALAGSTIKEVEKPLLTAGAMFTASSPSVSVGESISLIPSFGSKPSYASVFGSLNQHFQRHHADDITTFNSNNYFAAGSNDCHYVPSGIGGLEPPNGLGEAPSMIIRTKIFATNISESSDLDPLSSSDAKGVSPTTDVTSRSPLSEEYEYVTEKVGEIERAPHAMFEYNGELVVSTISRNGISNSPIYTYSDDNGLQRRSQLPDANESGNYGFSSDDGLHIVAEAWEGMIDYVAQSPDGPWIKHDYTHLNPHSYKNLKWGFGYRDPATGQQFMGFGNDEAPGVVITSEAGEWKLLSAPKDMLFPTSMGVITDGPNAGTRLICSSTYDKTRLHAVDANGQTRKLGNFEGWSYMVADPNNRIAYVATEKGKVFWSSFDDLKNWKECQYQDAQGNSLDKLGRSGELNVHPQTGQVILPAADNGYIGNNKPTTEMGTNLYEAVPMDNTVVFRQIGRIEGAGLWELRSTVVGNELYYGTGLVSDKKQDAALGAIYKISASGEASGLHAVESNTLFPELQYQNKTDEEFVTGLYKVFFDREPESDGLEYHLTRLKNGVDIKDVFKGFLYSPEFMNLSDKYGISEELNVLQNNV